MRPGLVYTLVFIKTNFNILLGLKKRGLGKNKWNGFGGKVETNETILEGAIRETKEESNLTIVNPQHIGVLTYEEQCCQKIDIVHVFVTENYSDKLQESEEMRPKWFNIEDVPYNDMWPDATFWHPVMLEGKFFHAHTIYNDENSFKSCVVEQYDSITDVIKNMDHLIKQKSQQII